MLGRFEPAQQEVAALAVEVPARKEDPYLTIRDALSRIGPPKLHIQTGRNDTDLLWHYSIVVHERVAHPIRPSQKHGCATKRKARPMPLYPFRLPATQRLRVTRQSIEVGGGRVGRDHGRYSTHELQSEQAY